MNEQRTSSKAAEIRHRRLLLAITHYNAVIVTENHSPFVIGPDICVKVQQTFTGFHVHVYKITWLVHPQLLDNEFQTTGPLTEANTDTQRPLSPQYLRTKLYSAMQTHLYEKHKTNTLSSSIFKKPEHQQCNWNTIVHFNSRYCA